ncbi:cytochrome P450 [Pilobolus umbonatus]|nr:cytochrome P450 [Pilobolus umbonatus]
MNERQPHFTDKHETPYTFSVLRECLRYKPVSQFGLIYYYIVEVDGYVIPANTVLVPSMNSMNRNPSIYRNPDTFIPDRFIHDTKSMMASANGKTEDRDQFSFGWGRRICPSFYLAEIQMYLAFTMIIARSVIEPVDELPNLSEHTTTNPISQPLPYKVKFIRRG